MTDNSSGADQLILNLAHALYSLKRADWVNTRTVAKRLHGTEDDVVRVISVALLPEARPYFSLTHDGRKIRFTERGIRFAQQTPPDPQPAARQASPTGSIARAVVEYASTLERQTLAIQSVATIRYTNQRYVQAVQVEALGDDIVPTDTPVDLAMRRAGRVNGRVVGQEPDGNTLYVALEREVRQEDAPYKLSIDRAFLLTRLAESLEKLPDVPELARPLLEDGKKAAGVPIAGHNSVAVADALANLRPNWTRFLWGPPGSGKTYALGRLITRLLNEDATIRVLLVAPSNLAADVALEQFLMQATAAGLGPLVDGRRVLRYGYPRKTSLLARPEVLGPEALSELTGEIKALSARLALATREHMAEEELAVLRTEMLAMQEALRRLVANHIDQCRLVVTTTAQAYLRSSPLSEMVWDSVLVDEVTMVPPAVCVFLASRASRRLLLAGDPRQLGPIFEETRDTTAAAKRWMGTDVFEVAGISRGAGEQRTVATTDGRVARITSQRRCTADIWRRVAGLYPQVANLVDETRNAPLRALEPAAGLGLAVLDLNQLFEDAHCEAVHSSWQNVGSGLLAIALAEQVRQQSPEASIAIITPYRAQVQFIKKHLRGMQQKDSQFALDVEVGTIHQFQGSEADVVIFDMVDGPGRRGLGRLLKDDAGLRLATVAITRARGKCLILADRKWFRGHVGRGDNVLLWDLVVGSGVTRLF